MSEDKKKRIGALEDRGSIGPEFFEPLPNDELALWNGEGETHPPPIMPGDPVSEEDVVAAAIGYFRDEAKAHAWVSKEKTWYEGGTPGEMMESAEGRRELLDVLGRLEYGIFS
jgi:hypothetical protein